ncbi:MAG: TetR/AcrR family transcriptional regulator [Firmicutes bacterium]|nr:TetR/AcrR family transcriptional regulator [Bacillota bacterium]MDY5531651.1 TetR/AcrR family transcriptional regulator [Pumilibacteraceae bacterium]
MRTRNQQEYTDKKRRIMTACFECYAQKGLHGTGISALAQAADVSQATLYTYFADIDQLIVQSTEYCMSQVENEFMEKAPVDAADVERFLLEVPYWTAREHGAKYRLMYQVYTHPKYIEYGKRYFEGVNRRYFEYACLLEPKIGLPKEVITPLIFIFVRACVHYAMFEDEYYLKTQIEVLRKTFYLFLGEYKSKETEKQ